MAETTTKFVFFVMAKIARHFVSYFTYLFIKATSSSFEYSCMLHKREKIT